jgi:hypothetical protein
MVTREDLESFLLRSEQEYEEVEPGMWTMQAGADARLVIHYSPPLVILRAKVLDIPEGDSGHEALFRRLLELNAMDLVHGAYGIEADDVILSDSLELENLNFNEFQASLDSIQVGLASHLEELSPYREQGTGNREQPEGNWEQNAGSVGNG